MSMFKDPFDAKSLLSRCSCSGAHAPSEHKRLTAAPVGEEQQWTRVVDAAVLRAVSPSMPSAANS